MAKRKRLAVAEADSRVYSCAVAGSEVKNSFGEGSGDSLDPGALNDVLSRAERTLSLRRVFLFGSRARGDARRNSDVDLAFEHDSSPGAWAEFVNAIREEAPLLLDFDLVDLDKATPELRERIMREGRLLRG